MSASAEGATLGANPAGFSEGTAEVAEKPHPGSGAQHSCSVWPPGQGVPDCAMPGQQCWCHASPPAVCSPRRTQLPPPADLLPALLLAGSSRIGARPGASSLVDPQTEPELAASGLQGA
jgi:hypothetical protein